MDTAHLEASTLRCPFCTAEIRKGTIICPFCRKNINTGIVSGPAPSSISPIAGSFIGVGIVVFLCVAFGLYSEFGPDPRRDGYPPQAAQASVNPTPADTEKDKREAYFASQQFVEDQLKSPASAQFPYADAADVVKIGEGRFKVVAYVDAQNSFGALLRNNYVALMRKEGENWFCERVELKPR